MFLRVVQDVDERATHFERTAQHVRVVAIGEDRAASSTRPIQTARDAREQSAHAASERVGVTRFEDQVQVVRLHRAVNDAETRAGRGSLERLEDDVRAGGAAQTRQPCAHSNRHQHGESRRQPDPRVPRAQRLLALGLPAGTGALSAVPEQFDLDDSQTFLLRVHHPQDRRTAVRKVAGPTQKIRAASAQPKLESAPFRRRALGAVVSSRRSPERSRPPQERVGYGLASAWRRRVRHFEARQDRVVEFDHELAGESLGRELAARAQPQAPA